VIRYENIIGIYKRNTAKLFPNAIEVVTTQHKHFFCSFMFRDAAFRLASTAWNDYLEASPSNETHRIILNSKLDYELWVKKPNGGEEQVKMIEEDDAEGSESSYGTSPQGQTASNGLPYEEKTGSSKVSGKLNDSGKSNPTSAAAPMSTLFSAAGVVDSSEDVEVGSEDRKSSKRRKSSQNRKRDITGTGAPRATSDGEDSEELLGRRVGSADATSPNAARHTVVVSSGSGAGKQPSSSSSLNAKAVGFDLRSPAGGSESVLATASAANGGSTTNVNHGVTESESGAEKPSGVNDSPAGDRRAQSQNGSTGGDSSSMGGMSESASAQSVEAPPLPDVPVPVPTTLACKHTVEEVEDKKYTGSKLGSKTYKNLTIAQFFALVFSNPEYASLLAKDLEYSEWNAPPWALNEAGCCLQRLVTYRMPLKSGIGPKSTRVDSTQNVRYKNSNVMLLESSNISKDVPLSDAFEVHEKWLIQQDGPNVTVDVTAGVVWKKTAWGLKGTINTKSIEGATESFEHVCKIMDVVISKYTSEVKRSGSATNNASSSSNVRNARVKAPIPLVEDEDDSSSDEERKIASKSKSRRHTTKPRKGSKDSSELRDSNNSNETVSQSTPTAAEGSRWSIGNDWKVIAMVVLVVLALGAVSSLFFNIAQMSARLQAVESHRAHGSPNLSHEDMSLRERVAFLEHLTTALLHNISDPGSYKSEQQRYWMAIRDLDKFLVQTRDNVHTLQSTVHDVYAARNDPPLSTATVVDALRTLPIDRKVLNYLTNPEGFAQHLAAVLAAPADEFLNNIAASASNFGGSVEAPESSFMWPFYYGMALCLLLLVAIAVARTLGLKLS
jgi:hypothetical protein